MTPDPAGMAAADPANPQSWNRYAYVMNNPLNATDPLGLQSASENDQCSPNSGRPIDGGISRDPGLECGTGAIDGSDPHSPKTPPPIVVPGQTITVTPDDAPNSMDEMIHIEAVFEQLAKSTQDKTRWTWTFTKSFLTFKGGPGNKPTCAGQTLKSIGNDLTGGLFRSQAAETSLKAASAYQEASTVRYAASRPNTLGGIGLICPSCSSVYRSMMEKAGGPAFRSFAKAGEVKFNRQYSFLVQRRWMTPDPAGMAAADPANPQSWNRYAYVMNNPLNATDPFGLQTASENDQCSPNSGQPVGDGNQRQPGKECGTNAIDGSDPHPPKVVTPPMHVYADALDPIQTIYADIGVFVSLVNGTWHPHSTTPNTTSTNPRISQPCGRLNAFKLDYSQPIHPGGVTSKDHILQNHTTGMPGKSQYRGNWFGIKVINFTTYLFGTDNIQGASHVFNFTWPQVFAPFVTYDFGTDPTGQHTASNRLVTTGNCTTVVTSYPVAQ